MAAKNLAMSAKQTKFAQLVAFAILLEATANVSNGC